MSLPEPFEHTMSTEQLAQLGGIIRDWAGVDFMLGAAVTMVCNLSGPEGTFLAASLDDERKLQVLNKASERLPPQAQHYLRELKHCLSSYKGSRNILAHGLTMHNSDGQPVFTSLRTDTREVRSLPLFREQSKYTGIVAKRLVFALGMDLGSLPNYERPPK